MFYFYRFWTLRDKDISWKAWFLWLFTGIPEMIERSFYYVVAFSSALAVLNAVPCIKLDGQHIVKCFIIDLQIPFLNPKDNIYNRGSMNVQSWQRTKFDQWRKTFAKVLTIFGTVLLLLNVLLGCSKSFGLK